MSIIKKCLLIGINYIGTSHALNGCINDSENLREFLIKGKYFSSHHFIMMNDKLSKSDRLYPTKANILKKFNDLIRVAKRYSSRKMYIFMAYSGHGSNLVDTNGDEVDGKDEVLCPVDFVQNGYITDDFLRSNFVYKLPSNVRLVSLIDACNSGTVMDLKFNYEINKLNTYATHGFMSQTKCLAIMISGCRDDQYSYDAYLEDRNTGKYEYQGAMTASFISTFKDGISYTNLINGMRKWLSDHEFPQVPQLSSGRYINTRGSMLLGFFN